MIPLSGYTYLGQLGEPGNFGTVFHARNDLSGLDVAIKHIDAPMSPRALKGWEAEASAMAACQHDNIVAILHAEVTPDGPALVMEYLPDGSVAGRYRDGPAPVGDVADIVVAACWGLHRLHLEGLTHRDIKPGNLLCGGRTVKLGDFGLARTTGDPVDEAYILHTPPEVIAGEPWTEVSDLYAVGATAWRLLWGDASCGRYEPDTVGLARAGKWPDRSAWPRHAHKRLRTALRAAMHPDPSKRPKSAADMRSGVERARPIVSWVVAGPGSWEGIGAGGSWEVAVHSSNDRYAVLTTRDTGSGARRVTRLCEQFSTNLGALDGAERVLESLAHRGYP